MGLQLSTGISKYLFVHGHVDQQRHQLQCRLQAQGGILPLQRSRGVAVEMRPGTLCKSVLPSLLLSLQCFFLMQTQTHALDSTLVSMTSGSAPAQACQASTGDAQ
eukprot:6482605-Amphidinium_carterae.1